MLESFKKVMDPPTYDRFVATVNKSRSKYKHSLVSLLYIPAYSIHRGAYWKDVIDEIKLHYTPNYTAKRGWFWDRRI